MSGAEMTQIMINEMVSPSLPIYDMLMLVVQVSSGPSQTASLVSSKPSVEAKPLTDYEDGM